MWRLKPEKHAFEVVDGPLAGRAYRKGETYTDIPGDMAAWFEPVFPPEPGPEVNELTSQEDSDAE